MYVYIRDAGVTYFFLLSGMQNWSDSAVDALTAVIVVYFHYGSIMS